MKRPLLILLHFATGSNESFFNKRSFLDGVIQLGDEGAGLWLHDDEAFPEAFDDHADFERNDVVAALRANPDAFGAIPIWNDYGKFMAGNAAFVAARREGHANLTAHVWPGEFDNSYPHWPQYLRFYEGTRGLLRIGRTFPTSPFHSSRESGCRSRSDGRHP